MSYIDEIAEIWHLVYKNIEDLRGNSYTSFWFKDLKLAAFENNTVIFSTDSLFKYERIKADGLVSMLEEEFGHFIPCKVDIVLEGSEQEVEISERASINQEDRERGTLPDYSSESFGLYSSQNSEYTFDNFIVGNSNKFACAACKAVAREPAKDYNPLFIYGPSGLGKTHLICAVVNEIKKKRPSTKVIYINGEDFTNQLIESLARNDAARFHNKFRSCDVLLIDDIQFIAGKISTQEEFFHTFNALYEDKKQIILTSDRPPKDISTLEERLRTRFEWGLIADIQPPDLELRQAIFKQKIKQSGITVSDDVILFLAENLRSNIRQIEGAIKKLSAKSFIMEKDIDITLAKSCLDELLGGEEPVSVTVDKIFSAVYNKYNVSKEDIKGKSRVKAVTWARQVAMYLIREITSLSYPTIGEMLNKDHATVMHSISVVKNKIQKDAVTNVEINTLIKEISG